VVYDRILELVVDGEAGDSRRLPTEVELARRLGVSRPTIREALARLREDGVIVSRRGSGTYVQRVPSKSILSFAPLSSIADMQRCFDFRIALEGEAAFHAGQPGRSANFAELDAALASLERAAEGALATEEDFAFHLAVARLSENRFFEATLLSLKDSVLTGMTVTRNLSLMRPRARLLAVVEEHVTIADAIRASNPEQARQAMRQHLTNAKRRVFEGAS
jgi:DNA-binding FadR family transcriptional regulator